MQSENYNKLKSVKYKVKNYKEFNQYMKSDKMPYIIYADIECLIKKLDVYANNPEKYSATKPGEYIPCGYSMSTIWAFDHIETSILYVVLKIVSKCFVIFIRENAANVINFEKNEMSPLRKIG